MTSGGEIFNFEERFKNATRSASNTECVHMIQFRYVLENLNTNHNQYVHHILRALQDKTVFRQALSVWTVQSRPLVLVPC